MDQLQGNTQAFNTETPVRHSRRLLGGGFLPVIVVAVFIAGIAIGRTSASRPVAIPENITGAELGRPASVDASVIWDVWQRLEAKYVDQSKIDPQKMVYGAAEGVVRALGDPYSVFMPPQEAKRFQEDVRGSFEGIGAEIGIRKETLTIIAPLEGSPAQRAGLLAGDKILKIDDAITADLTLEEAVSLIRGPHNSAVRLTIARDDVSENKEVTIKRDVIKVPVISWEMKETPKGAVAWIKMHHFSESLLPEFERTVKAVQARRPAGIVLDLRNNPGGFLEVAVDIAGSFLGADQLVVTEAFGDGRRREYRTSGYAPFRNMPIIVLINEGSASASEILAGALRDHRNIQLVGKRSFGKGSVQELESLPGGASLKITVAKWVTPKGTILSDGGLEPDATVEMTVQDIERNKDPQLDKALELIQQVMSL